MADIQIHQGRKDRRRTVSVQAVIVFGFSPAVLHPVKSVISVILFCLLQQIFVVPLFIRICHAAGNAKPGYRHIDCQFCNGNTKGSFPQGYPHFLRGNFKQKKQDSINQDKQHGNHNCHVLRHQFIPVISGENHQCQCCKHCYDDMPASGSFPFADRCKSHDQKHKNVKE